jgi:hypothetical protein
MIDPATGWFEIVDTKTKRTDEIANLVELTWLTRYPWPEYIIYDHGGEFIGKEFQELIKQEYDIKGRPSSKRNPQSNAILERVHGTLANMLRTFELQTKEIDKEDTWKGILAAVAWAIRSTFHTINEATPGQLVFGQDMIWNIQYQADWKYLKEKKQKLINKRNETENKNRKEHDYAVGDLVLTNKADVYKAEQPREGPYEIIRVHTNGTVTIQKGAIIERLNIHQIAPFHRMTINQGGECNILKRNSR